MAYRVAEFREAAGLSQEQLARMIGTSQRNVSNYESAHDLKTSAAVKIADALGVDLYDLLGIRPRRRRVPDGDDRIDAYWEKLNGAGRSRLLDYARMLVQLPENTSSKNRRADLAS